VSRVIAADADFGGLTRSLDRLKTDKVEPVGLDARDQDQVAGLMRQVQAVIVLLPVSFHSYGAVFPEPKAATGPLRYKISWTFDGVLKSYWNPSSCTPTTSATWR